MIIDDRYYESYDELIDEYKEKGDNLLWSMKDGNLIKINNMTTKYITNCINMMKNKEQNDRIKAWIFIFEDVIIKRRINIINKIKNKIS